MAKTPIICAWCAAESLKERGAVNRSRAAGLALYCDRTCAGFARRRPDDVAPEELKARKAEYDRSRREELRDRLKAEKRAYHLRTYDPEREREKRKLKMPAHVEYCRQPEYRKWKADYDKKYCARKQFGTFGEAAIILNQLETEILSRASRVEIARTNGTLNKHQARRRDYDRQTQRS